MPPGGSPASYGHGRHGGCTRHHSPVCIALSHVVGNGPCWELNEYGVLPEWYAAPEVFEPRRKEAVDEEDQELKTKDAIRLMNFMFYVFRKDANLSAQMAAAWVRLQKWLLEQAPPFYIETLLWVAALISCGLGISALEWSKINMKRVLVSYDERWILALAPDLPPSLLETSSLEYVVVRAKEYYGMKRLCLLAGYPGDNPFYRAGLFPPDIFEPSFEQEELGLVE
jgi:hypothetical protein